MLIKSFLARVFQGYRTGTFPTKSGPKLPPSFKGRPVLDASMTKEDLELAASVCPCEGCLKMVGKVPVKQGGDFASECGEKAEGVTVKDGGDFASECGEKAEGVTVKDGGDFASECGGNAGTVPALDMGKCIFCGKCAEVCKKIKFTDEYRLGVFRREDLIVRAGEGEYVPPRNPNPECEKILKRSFQLREVSAGGCAACELDFNVLGTLAWDLGRFGMKVVASPRHADAVYVTGPVSRNMSLALKKTFEAMAEPRFVIAGGACAISGGLYGGSPYVEDGTAKSIPEPDLFIPGCPPHPATTLEALLRFIGRA